MSGSSSAHVKKCRSLKNYEWHPVTPSDTYPYRLLIVKLYRQVPRKIAENIEFYCKKNFELLTLCLGQIASPYRLLTEIKLLIDLLLRRIHRIRHSKFRCQNQCLMKDECPHIRILMWPVLKMLIDLFRMNVNLRRPSRQLVSEVRDHVFGSKV